MEKKGCILGICQGLPYLTEKKPLVVMKVTRVPTICEI
jgi:hypothetical protein